MMVSSAGSTTLPVYVYGMMRLGVTPEVNAISTVLLAISLVFVASDIMRRVRKYPPDWFELSDSDLLDLSNSA